MQNHFSHMCDADSNKKLYIFWHCCCTMQLFHYFSTNQNTHTHYINNSHRNFMHYSLKNYAQNIYWKCIAQKGDNLIYFFHPQHTHTQAAKISSLCWALYQINWNKIRIQWMNECMHESSHDIFRNKSSDANFFFISTFVMYFSTIEINLIFFASHS